MRPWTQADNIAFIEAVKAGEAHDVLAQRFRRTGFAIEVRIAKFRTMGLLPPDAGRKLRISSIWTAAHDAKLIKLMADGATPDDVADAMYRSRDAVVKHIAVLRARGALPPSKKPQVPWTHEDCVRALQWSRQGMAVAEIARRINRPPGSVASKLKLLRQDTTGSKDGRSGPVSLAALADRDRRYNLSRPTLTAEFFGDPLPGYSALDRRQVR